MAAPGRGGARMEPTRVRAPASTTQPDTQPGGDDKSRALARRAHSKLTDGRAAPLTGLMGRSRWSSQPAASIADGQRDAYGAHRIYLLHCEREQRGRTVYLARVLRRSRRARGRADVPGCSWEVCGIRKSPSTG